jgi:DNA-binding CsgD family transcriptional regulator
VTFHVGNVVKKLNASNKTAAAVRAAVLGLL